MFHQRRQLTASQRSSTLAALLAVVAVVLVWAGSGLRPPVTDGHMLVRALLLAGMFAAAELALLHIEFRHEAYTFSLSGLPLAVGVLTSSPLTVVLARLAGTAIVFLIQRPGRYKAIYNLASYALEVALFAVAFHFAVNGRHSIDAVVVIALTGLLICTDVLMSTLVLKVISWYSGPTPRSERIRVYASGAVIALLASLLGLTFTILIGEGVVGILLLVGLSGVFAVIHRAYAALHRRHESLELVHTFVSTQSDALTVDEVVGELLGQICTSLRASHVSIYLDGWEGEPRLLLVNEDGEASSWDASPLQTEDALYARTQGVSAKSIVLPRGSGDSSIRGWLMERGLRDGMLIPVADHEGHIGTMLVADRQGETATFGADDLPVAQTLAAHTAVALRNAALLQRLRHDANHDSLTGIPNRHLLQVTLDRLETDAGAGFGALLLLDLDRFKEVNDVLGHVAGDRLLCIVAERLTALAPDGLVVRLGGDEFAVLLTGIAANDEAEATLVAEAFASHAIVVLKEPVMVAGIALNADASIGVAVFMPGEVDPGELLRHADLAMYAVKGTGRAVGVYTQILERGQADRLALVADLRIGIDRDELVMKYQPKLDLQTGAIVGVEALVRWQHPKLGLLAPDSFIQLAESAGLIDQLTDAALRMALAQCRNWRDCGYALSIAVNLSAHNLHDEGLAIRVASMLRDAGLPADALTLEITEGSVVSEPERAIPILESLSELGCILSLDDFGTGYSSLSYLQNLPVQEVKIDRSFVTDFKGDKRREALVAAIIGLGEALSLRVVAEGIEDVETLDHLRMMGCDVAQGYLIGRPVLPYELEPLLHEKAAKVPAQRPAPTGAIPAAPARSRVRAR